MPKKAHHTEHGHSAGEIPEDLWLNTVEININRWDTNIGALKYMIKLAP